jgi:LacI family transcriptional regulator
VTAIFCATDLMAVGALRALEEAGRAVPEQVSCGTDTVTPGLASVRLSGTPEQQT